MSESIFNVTDKTAFVKSKYIKVYPCGRRRGMLSTTSGTDPQKTINTYIPFDPEARLNTELNHRRLSGINGYQQSYVLTSFAKEFTFVVDGYYFIIDTSKYNDLASFINGMTIAEDDIDTIYANIRIQSTPIYADSVIGASVQTYYTDVLRNQTISDNALSALDLVINQDAAKLEEPSNYYFSGLTFTLNNLASTSYDTAMKNTAIEATKKENGIATYVTINNSVDNVQKVASLAIFKKVNNTWVINEQAKLPDVQHGPVAGSVFINDLYTNGLNINDKLKITADDLEFLSKVKIKAGLDIVGSDFTLVDENDTKKQTTVGSGYLNTIEATIDNATIADLTVTDTNTTNLIADTANIKSLVIGESIKIGDRAIPLVTVTQVDDKWQLSFDTHVSVVE